MAHRTAWSPDPDVRVVGAGPAGSVAATQPARHGLDVLVLDRRVAVSALPRAVGVTVRQMEIFRAWGAEEELRAGADEVDLALLQTRTVAEVGEETRVPINVPDLAQSSVVSPTAPTRMPQDHFEQVLADHLARLTGRPVRRGAEVVGISQDEEGVRLSVRGAASAGGGLLVRPDAVPVASWYRVTDVPRAVAELERTVDDVLGHRAATVAGAA